MYGRHRSVTKIKPRIKSQIGFLHIKCMNYFVYLFLQIVFIGVEMSLYLSIGKLHITLYIRDLCLSELPQLSL